MNVDKNQAYPTAVEALNVNGDNTNSPFVWPVIDGVGRGRTNKSYNRQMAAHVIGNPVPTPEEMGEILGLSSDRVAAVRRIMDTSHDQKPSTRSVVASRAAARKKSAHTRTPSARAAEKK